MPKWPKQHTDYLRELVGENHSASTIAMMMIDKFGPVAKCSRSAVIGKSSRMGLRLNSAARGFAARINGNKVIKDRPAPRPPRESGKDAGIVRSLRKQFSQASAPIKVPPAPKEAPPIVCQPVTFSDLRRTHCKWPLGDPRDDDFMFCGAPRPGDSPYCLGHQFIAHVQRSYAPRTRPDLKPSRFTLTSQSSFD